MGLSGLCDAEVEGACFVVMQASGEALYADDIAADRDCLHAAFVASTEALAVIKSVDASAALALPGVVAYFGAADIPGTNKASTGEAEQLFATDKVPWPYSCPAPWAPCNAPFLECPAHRTSPKKGEVLVFLGVPCTPTSPLWMPCKQGLPHLGSSAHKTCLIWGPCAQNLPFWGALHTKFSFFWVPCTQMSSFWGCPAHEFLPLFLIFPFLGFPAHTLFSFRGALPTKLSYLGCPAHATFFNSWQGCCKPCRTIALPAASCRWSSAACMPLPLIC
jgi:hypothetical protein